MLSQARVGVSFLWNVPYSDATMAAFRVHHGSATGIIQD
jgi:hypothetical protein